MNDTEAVASIRANGKGSKKPSGRSGANAPPIDMGMLPDLIGFNLRCAQLALFQHFSATVGAASISPPQFGTLLLIESNPGMSQSAVAEALRFDRSTLVQIIDRLEGRGLVVREVSAQDRRSHALRLTDSGAALLHRLKEAAAEHEREVAKDLSEADKVLLIELLRRIHSPKA